jgi:hypothetical protein
LLASFPDALECVRNYSLILSVLRPIDKLVVRIAPSKIGITGTCKNPILLVFNLQKSNIKSDSTKIENENGAAPLP